MYSVPVEHHTECQTQRDILQKQLVSKADERRHVNRGPRIRVQRCTEYPATSGRAKGACSAGVRGAWFPWKFRLVLLDEPRKKAQQKRRRSALPEHGDPLRVPNQSFTVENTQ